MFDELDKYKNKGHFFFQRGSKLKEVSANVPNLPGVYYIYRLCRGAIDLVYIGKSGTVLPNGEFKDQLLNKRLNSKQDGMPRQKFFEQKLIEEGSDALDIYWYVTFDEENQDIPSYVEDVLLQRYFRIYGRLPEWNNEF
ncbi:hypothetical protein LJC05_01045 [Bacteroides sp. OttesenSCG-928-J23]|nr:hypothetical protein [Bacteroides sp. OttesenSCG-928-J23]MDL2304856.1 hypothetical protein [Bacteroides sp. OttesenSCG-928-D19]